MASETKMSALKSMERSTIDRQIVYVKVKDSAKAQIPLDAVFAFDILYKVASTTPIVFSLCESVIRQLECAFLASFYVPLWNASAYRRKYCSDADLASNLKSLHSLLNDVARDMKTHISVGWVKLWSKKPSIPKDIRISYNKISYINSGASSLPELVVFVGQLPTVYKQSLKHTWVPLYIGMSARPLLRSIHVKRAGRLFTTHLHTINNSSLEQQSRSAFR